MPPKVLILRAAGTNCDVELAHAFELAGAAPERVHVNALVANVKDLDRFAMIGIPGGFSYGDDIAAGRILANQIVHHFGDALRRFVERGGLIVGICNGFQVLVKTGLLPGGTPELRQRVTLTMNDSGRFEDRWVRLASQTDRCVWLRGVERIELPIAHGEGKFVPDGDETLEELRAGGQIALRYCDAAGQPAPYPVNPNGSVDDVAGICDPTGRVLGLMPHPERFTHATNHPTWTRRSKDAEPDGLQIFRNAVEAVSG